VTFVVDAPHADVTGYEVVLKDGQAVGHVTSGGWGHAVGTSIACGYVPADLARDGETFKIDILGVECDARITGKALYDPEGLKLRS
jgi:dimethylglycine dehydrogenase